MSRIVSSRGEPVEVTTADGAVLCAAWHPPDGKPRGALLALPALAAPSRSLRALCVELSALGWGVLRADYRHTGESRPTADRAHDASMADHLDGDVPALLTRLEELAPGVPLACLGHSLGGQLSALSLARHAPRVRAAVLVTTAFPFEALWPFPRRAAVAAAFRLYPFMARRHGALPARPVGMGEVTPRTLVEEWGAWGRTGRYVARGVDLDGVLAQVTGPVLSVGSSDDLLYGPPPALEDYLRRMPRAAVTRGVMTPAECGAGKLGHFGVFHAPAVGVLAGRVTTWLEGVLVDTKVARA